MIRCSRQAMKVSLGLAVFLTSTLIGGCGYKDKPVAPQQIVPKPVADLQFQRQENGITLYWGYPRETVTGQPISEITEFKLYRAVVPAESYCETCPLPFSTPISLPGGTLPDHGGKTASYQATVLRPGNLYFFKVRSATGWFSESEDSNIVSFLWQTPPQAPEGLNAASGDGKITLSWNPVHKREDSTQLHEQVRYQVYRSLGNGRAAKLGKPVATTQYTDTTALNGKNYVYQVQAITSFEHGDVGGKLSQAVQAAAQDKTPPPVPGGIEAVATDLGVKVFWDHVEASDLAGYKVYRRSGSEQGMKYVGEVKLPYNLFLDKSAPHNQDLHYSVTSFDNKNPANESAKSKGIVISN